VPCVRPTSPNAATCSLAPANFQTCTRPRSRCWTRSRFALAPYGDAKFKFDALPPMRLAAPFEALRDKSDAGSKALARGQRSSSQSRHACRFHRARHLCQELFRNRRIEAIDTTGFADPEALAAAFKASGAGAACLCSSDKVYAGRAVAATKALQAAEHNISIWQAGPASRKPRCARPASAISSLPAMTRWQCCRKPGGGWSEHDGREQICSDGGCQCGAVRFAVSGAPAKISVCHCRMCQKASGAPFALVRRYRACRFQLDPRQAGGVQILFHRDARLLRRLRHAPNFRRIDGPRIEIMTGAFDRPDRLVPTRQYGTESRLGWVSHRQPAEPDHATELRPGQARTIVSHQHPDHD